MRSGTRAAGESWPRDMAIALDRADDPVHELLRAREAWALRPATCCS